MAKTLTWRQKGWEGENPLEGISKKIWSVIFEASSAWGNEINRKTYELSLMIFAYMSSCSSVDREPT